MLFNATQIRNRLIDWSKTNQLNNIFANDKGLCRNFFHRLDDGFRRIPYDKDFLYQYDLLFLTAFDVMVKRYYKSIDIVRLNEDAQYFSQQVDRITLLKNIIYADMQTVCYPVAIAAWLTIDNWRWPDKDLDHLSYGLVLQYPELLVLGAYITCIGDRDIMQRELSFEELDILKAKAKAAFNERQEIRIFSVINIKEPSFEIQQNQQSLSHQTSAPVIDEEEKRENFNSSFSYPPLEDLDGLDT